jgi:hypothetical protein
MFIIIPSLNLFQLLFEIYLQSNLAMEKSSSSSNATPVLGSLLSEGPIRMITQGIELSAEFDEKIISEVPIKDLQVYIFSFLYLS